MMLRIFIVALVVLTLSGCNFWNVVYLNSQIGHLQKNIKELNKTIEEQKTSLAETQQRMQLYDDYITRTYLCDFIMPICDVEHVEAGRKIIADNLDRLDNRKLFWLATQKIMLLLCPVLITAAILLFVYVTIINPSLREIDDLRREKADLEKSHAVLKSDNKRLVTANIEEQDRHHYFQDRNSILVEENEYRQQVISDQIVEIEHLTRMAEALKSL